MTPEQLAEARHAAIEDIRPHFAAWTALLEIYVDSLPPDSVLNDNDAARSYAEHELRAMHRDLGALLAIEHAVTELSSTVDDGSNWSDWRSPSCWGERCSICHRSASHKVEEDIFHDDPFALRHPLTAYVCTTHFRQIMGAAGCDQVEKVRQELWRLKPI